MMNEKSFRAIHSNDEMMAVMRNNGMGELAYLKSGSNNGNAFFEYVRKHRPELTHGARILDHGCGYGRVTRHLRKLFDAQELVAADVTAEMVEFCAEKFFAIPFLISGTNPISNLHVKVDVVISISVFSHLPQPLFDETLQGLSKIVRPGGILLVTTAGPGVAEQRGVAIGNEGFRFGAIGDKVNETKNRLRPDRYSSMIVSPEYMKARLPAAGLNMLEYVAKGHLRQDLFVLAPD